MDTVIQVEHLVHRYGEHPAVQDLSFSVRQGEVLGLLGPNGAGKTTTVRLINGLFPPTSGQMRVLGFNPVTQGNEVRARTGVLTETPALYERLTARQNLEFFGTLDGMSGPDVKARTAELLQFFNLVERANDRTGTYSKGMKQRLALARALLNHPPLLFLDEPTSGLDPEAAQQVHELVMGLRHRNGHSVLLATHNLFEAERLCDRLAILNKGHLLAIGSLDELRQMVAPGLWIQVDLFQPLSGPAQSGLNHIPGVLNSTPDGGLCWRVQVEREANIPNVVTALVQAGAQITAIQQQKVSLEEIYFKLQAQQDGIE